MFSREVQVGQDVFGGVLEKLGHLGELRGEHLSDLVSWVIAER